MKLSVKVFGICVVYMSLLMIGMKSVAYRHQYNQMAFAYHKALHITMLTGDDTMFTSVFNQLAPPSFSYTITVKGRHEYPRLRRIEVLGISDGISIRFDETMIEERLDE